MSLAEVSAPVLGTALVLFLAGLILIAASAGETLNFRVQIDPERKTAAMIGGTIAMIVGLVLGAAAFFVSSDETSATNGPNLTEQASVPPPTEGSTDRPQSSGATPTTVATTINLADDCRALALGTYQERMRFSKGRESATVRGSLSQGAARAYLLDVAAGQQIILNVQSDAKLLLCVLTEVGEEVFTATVSDVAQTIPLPRHQDYVVLIAMTSELDTVRYSLTISIPPLR